MKAEWKTVRLSEIALIGAGNSAPQKTDDFAADGPFFVRTSDVGEVKFGTVVSAHDRLSPLGSKGMRLWKSGTILIPKSGASTFVNHRVILGTDAHVSSHLATIAADTAKANPRFLLYYLSTVRAQDLIQDQSYPSLKLPEIGGIEIPLPPLAEQKRIADLLDKAFAELERLSFHARSRSSQALQIFEQERDDVFSNADNRYPESTISEISTRLQYGTSEKSSPKGRFVVLRMGNIQDGEIDYEDLKFTSSQEVIDQYRLNPGDVLFNRTNSPQWVGKSAIYRGEMPAVFAGYNIKIHTISDRIDSEFLTFFLNSERAMKFGRSTFTSSVNQANINAEKLRSYRLPLPSLPEQKTIAERLSRIKKMSRDLASLYQSTLAQSDELRSAILIRAFNGAL
jgi:type I restriction enzyme S subunit